MAFASRNKEFVSSSATFMKMKRGQYFARRTNAECMDLDMPGSLQVSSVYVSLSVDEEYIILRIE